MCVLCIDDKNVLRILWQKEINIENVTMIECMRIR